MVWPVFIHSNVVLSAHEECMTGHIIALIGAARGDFTSIVAILKADAFPQAVFKPVDLVLVDRSVGDLLRFAWFCPPMLADLLESLDERRSTVLVIMRKTGKLM